ncbi:tudor and KH domain-containing protein isoform B [Patagioenas fasciata monilis]|uniref:Tudor and KH domain-containing protein isoform B n=1 Tax=Patagioenas fasciata monilis TaxID=372326 RepID=A0A1V4JHB6_PATFA|nr:tudor and KH domain-containing protein isoform B [Patagioenas fasciata monilis]
MPSQLEHAMETLMFTFHKYAGDKNHLSKEDLRALMDKEFPGFLEELEIEMRVPRAAMKSIIGRKGATIKKLSQETGARITVEEEEGEEETALLIAGSPAQVCRAKAAVHRIVMESAPVTEQLCVPQRAVGRIIGRGGETVRGICRSSGARVLCEREADAGPGPIRVVQLSGTRAEVAAAKKLILEKLAEDVAFRKELMVAPVRCPVKQPLGRRRDREPLPDGEEEDEGATVWAEGSDLPHDEGEELEELAVPKFEVPSPDLGPVPLEPLQVFVSAAESPARFWVQLVGRRNLRLDRLRAEMRRHYQSSGHTAELLTVQAGDIVAAPSPDGGEWHRARVLGVQGDGRVGLHYVDFGDNGDAPPEALRALRSDFLSLPFQAIECSLAGIKPAAGDTWDKAALAAFQRLMHCARWTPVLATVTSYSQSGLCPRPSVRLFGLHHNQNLDVATELVRLGHAVPCPLEGSVGDGSPRPVPGAAAETPEPVTAASLESLLLEPQHSPGETPRTPSCLSLSDGASSGSEDGDGDVTETRSS